MDSEEGSLVCKLRLPEACLDTFLAFLFLLTHAKLRLHSL